MGPLMFCKQERWVVFFVFRNAGKLGGPVRLSSVELDVKAGVAACSTDVLMCKPGAAGIPGLPRVSCCLLPRTMAGYVPQSRRIFLFFQFRANKETRYDVYRPDSRSW